MMENAEFRVTAFPVQIKAAVLRLVEINTPFQEVSYTGRAAFHHLFHCCGVADVVSSNHGVLDVLLKVVHFKVCH